MFTDTTYFDDMDRVIILLSDLQNVQTRATGTNT